MSNVKPRFIIRTRRSDTGVTYWGVHDTLRPSYWTTATAVEHYGRTQCLLESSYREGIPEVVDALNALDRLHSGHLSPNAMAVLDELVQRIRTKLNPNNHPDNSYTDEALEACRTRLPAPRAERITEDVEDIVFVEVRS